MLVVRTLYTNDAMEGGEASCTSVKSAETHSKSNQLQKEKVTFPSGTSTAHSAEPGMTA